MEWINKYKEKHGDLFVYQKATEKNGHDIFLYRYFLHGLPESVTPNRLTLLRIMMTPPVFLLALYGHYAWGAFFFMIAAFTDAMDGTIARMRDQITDFGKLFDPLADKLLIGSMVLLLVFRYYPDWLGMAILAVEIMFIIVAYISHHYFHITRMANVWGKIKMWLQVIATFLVLLALLLDFPLLFAVAFWLFGFALGFALVSLFTYGV
ncbi:MAG: hypothetical protein A2538_03055 [Candidatus Magasanikbacteria bacterium RIFOXYD2_FULL_41_14]|uniref:CDP-diacylglycerol--glycerol-3-phosphate 3-phosphatidyltransferase n=1 Tax=Candidatus Magasanikbacteria bacterium RIFOXYD2_FULL_41_14 TaxID=1798709 RepID=A0A1F6PCZ8_9BACT|nr:MAG: hypothetical protein A2538_03055 [Candidatus Magasanikbacteria bacterium RIFOXYD2_FULL_41_14]